MIPVMDRDTVIIMIKEIKSFTNNGDDFNLDFNIISFQAYRRGTEVYRPPTVLMLRIVIT